MQLCGEWMGIKYDLLFNNCQTFCDVMCAALGVGPLPNRVRRIAKVTSTGVWLARHVATMSRTAMGQQPVPQTAGSRGRRWESRQLKAPWGVPSMMWGRRVGRNKVLPVGGYPTEYRTAWPTEGPSERQTISATCYDRTDALGQRPESVERGDQRSSRNTSEHVQNTCA